MTSILVFIRSYDINITFQTSEVWQQHWLKWICVKQLVSSHHRIPICNLLSTFPHGIFQVFFVVKRWVKASYFISRYLFLLCDSNLSKHLFASLSKYQLPWKIIISQSFWNFSLFTTKTFQFVNRNLIGRLWHHLNTIIWHNVGL